MKNQMFLTFPNSQAAQRLRNGHSFVIISLPFPTSSGVNPPKGLCGRNELYSCRHRSIFFRASSNDKNQWACKHSSLKLPLKGSGKGLSVSLPTLRSPISFGYHWPNYSAFEIKSLALSTVQVTLSNALGHSQIYCFWLPDYHYHIVPFKGLTNVDSYPYTLATARRPL